MVETAFLAMDETMDLSVWGAKRVTWANHMGSQTQPNLRYELLLCPTLMATGFLSVEIVSPLDL
jgi:hypothetical protein